MKLLIPLLLLVMHPAFGQITNPEKASQDLCDKEWQISDKAASTEDDTSKIVKNAMQDFKAMGYSFSDLESMRMTLRKFPFTVQTVSGT